MFSESAIAVVTLGDRQGFVVWAGVRSREIAYCQTSRTEEIALSKLLTQLKP